MSKTYLTFQERITPETRKTKIINVLSGTHYLGSIQWYTHWRRYCFYPHADTIFDASCLDEIILKIKSLMDERKND